jgi:hypothetical protein
MGRVLVILTGTFLLCLDPTHGRVLGAQEAILRVWKCCYRCRDDRNHPAASMLPKGNLKDMSPGLESNHISGLLQSVCTGYREGSLESLTDHLQQAKCNCRGKSWHEYR